jgi:hypothetical protein
MDMSTPSHAALTQADMTQVAKESIRRLYKIESLMQGAKALLTSLPSRSLTILDRPSYYRDVIDIREMARVEVLDSRLRHLGPVPSTGVITRE